MSEIDKYTFSYKEVVVALVKEQGLHEGIWMLQIEFGIGAINAGPTEEHMMPTAMIPVVKIGLTKTAKESNLSVDAAKVNPAKPAKASKK